jgi:hypothetical protein
MRLAVTTGVPVHRIEPELRWRVERRDLESVVRSARDWVQERDE